jgi:DNA-binding beta-propeller fold protein YncE
VYVTDPTQGEVIVRAPNGRIISRVGSLGYPVSVAVGNAGTIYVGDAGSGGVTAFNSDWQPVLQLGHGAGEFLQPSDLAVDAATGNLYVADSKAHLVKVYSAAGTFLQSFGGHGGGDGLFNFPMGVFVDAVAREVLVADQLNYRIEVFDVAGRFLSCFGAQGSGSGEFNMPHGVLVDGRGRIYVADSVEGRIQVLDRSGGFVGYIGDFGTAAAQLRIPVGMVIDPFNRLFVAAANNARLEVFGLDTFADPETILPAVIRMEPDPIDRATADANIVGYIEVPGYLLEQIVPSSIVANGVSAASIIVMGDHDGNGVPEIRAVFDRTALLATLPVDGAGTVVLSGLLGTKQFEGFAEAHITTCGPGAICSLGDAGPQCNQAVCVAAVGCTIQPKPDGTGCEDGNACTIEDACSGGTCVGASLSCDDGQACTDDTCNPSGGCMHTNNTAPCDDADPGTTRDACDGEGKCLGQAVTGNYALLGWPLESYRHRTANLAGQVLIRGDICTENIRVGPFSRIDGDTVAWASGGWAIAFGPGSQTAGDVVTGGGTLLGINQVTVGGRVDLGGEATEIAECFAARYRAASRRAGFVAFPPTPGLALGTIELGPGASRRIPSEGELGTGQSVIDATSLRLDSLSTLTLVGTAATEAVIVHIRGRMLLGLGARIAVDGLPAERLIFVTDGSVFLHSQASVSGSVFAAGRVHVGRASTITGALLGTAIELAPSATVDLRPFAGW